MNMSTVKSSRVCFEEWTKMMRGSISNMSSCSRHMYASFFRLWFVNGGEGVRKTGKGVENLKVLSSEMDPAKIGSFDRTLLKETLRRVFIKIRPSPIE